MGGWLHISWQDISTSDLPNILFLSLDMINCIFYGFKPNKIDAWYSIEYVSQYIDNVILYMDFCIIFVAQKTEYSTYIWDGAGEVNRHGKKIFSMMANNLCVAGQSQCHYTH